MKIKNLNAAFRSMEQPIPLLFRPLAEQQQQAASLPVIPTAANVLVPSLAVATAIKPTETVGSLVQALLQNKNTSEDRKVIVFAATPSSPARAIMIDTGVSDAAALTNEVLVATVVRDDATKETSSHTATIPGGLADEALAMSAVVEAALAAQKPKRSVASLVNAILDAIAADETLEEEGLGLVFNQDGDGSLKVYSGVTGIDAGPTGTKVADVTQEAAEVAASNPLW